MADAPPLTPPAPPLSQRLFGLMLWGGIAIALIVSFRPVEIWRFPMLFSNSANMREFGTQFFHPDFSDCRLYAAQMWLTVQIALWGTVLALAIAVPLALAGSRNIAPDWVRRPARWIMDVLRAVPDLVIGTLFLVAVGLGPFAGALALALNTGGVLGKLFSEAVEAVDPGPVEGVRATGAGRMQQVVWGVIPQVAPLWTSFGLYRFESNARAATVLGLIGAGGIGQVLFDALNSFAYSQVAAIAVVIVIAVSCIDLLSQTIRKRLI
jgi:phosphonate transport system permease protein